MNNTIQYLNTDLCLIGVQDLAELGHALEDKGLCLMFPVQEVDGRWYASFETVTEEENIEPERDIVIMLDAIESLPAPLLDVWESCTQREFNIGYDCGAEPWAFTQGLSTPLLQRLAKANGSLRFTLYPDRAESLAPPADENLTP
jgi:hypothetical protein